jgi:hypothetical protein
MELVTEKVWHQPESVAQLLADCVEKLSCA